MLGLAFSLVAAVPEKVWFCTRKGYSPWERPTREDVGTHDQGGHCTWYSEADLQQVFCSPLMHASILEWAQNAGAQDQRLPAHSSVNTFWCIKAELRHSRSAHSCPCKRSDILQADAACLPCCMALRLAVPGPYKPC